ncbi:MAG: hypothetical protein EPO23_01820 [Xanthobacteraceae bacterium]|nr:MAG: hypothetical protein EPO23_01820 [Xanthobacteraceae bacterium]
MFETNETTATRLVMTLGSRNRNFAKVTLDKTAGTARFERRLLIFPRPAIELPLAEIAAADPIVITAYRADHYVLVKTRAGRNIWLAGDSGEASITAARQIRAFVGLPEPAAGADPVPRSTRWLMWASSAMATVAVVVYVGGQLIRLFTLPACDSATALDTARDILKRNATNPVTLTEARSIGENKSERRCRALLTVQGDTATVGYRVYKEGLSTMVQMTGLVGTDTLDPARLSAIKEAAKLFLDRAAESYRSGSPPRRSEADVARQIDLIFDTTPLRDKTLAATEIQHALDWYVTGDSAGTVYVLAGTGFNDPGKVPATEAMQQRMQSNVVNFADEFGRYVDFQVTILAAAAKAITAVEMNSVTEDWSKSAAKARAPEVRADFAQTMGSGLIALAYAGYSDDWRMARLATFKAVAPVAASFLSAEESKAVRERALQIVDYQQNRAVQDELRKLADLVANP